MEKMPECVVEKEFIRKRAYDVIRVVEEEGFSLKICEWGCRAFISITGNAMQTKNSDAMADFLDDEACEVLINIMHKYAAISSEIATSGCLTICILAWSLREMREFLGEIGACEIVVFATSMHVGEPKVSEYGSMAIALLSKHNISNSYRLAEAGACDIVSQVGNFGFNVRNERCVEVATNVCHALADLSEAVNAARLLACGANGLVVELLKFHLSKKELVFAAVSALCALASLNVQHREELGRVGACEIILEVIHQYLEITPLIQQACEAIMHLALSPNNTVKLTAAGACETIVYCLHTRLIENDCGPEVCTGAMFNLTTYGLVAKENRLRLYRAGAAHVLRQTKMSTKVSYRARENIQALLDMMSFFESQDQSIVDTMNGSTSVPTVISARPTGAVGSSISTPASVTSSMGTPGASTVASIDGLRNGQKVPGIVSVSVIHGSEMKGDTIPLTVEIREVVEYDSYHEGHQPKDISPTRRRISSVEDVDDSAPAYTVPTKKNGVVEL